jgi:hypothetical protein
MFVIQNRDIKILSKPDIDESRILDIFVNDDDEKCFSYEFFFNADLRQAINTGNFQVRVTARKIAKEKTVRFMSDIEDTSPLGLVRSLYTKDTHNKRKLRVNDKTGLIRRSFVDLTEYVPNLKIKNAKRLSDRALFGTVRQTEMFSVAELKRQGMDVTLPQRNMLRKSDTSSKRFIQNYQIAIKNGVDPSVLTVPIDSMTKADPRKRGTFTQKRERKSPISLKGARDTAMKIVEQGDSNPFNVSGMSDGDKVALTVENVDRIKLISKRMILKKKWLGTNKFYLKLDVISPKNIIVQSMTIIIDHLQNIKDYYVPREIVKIRANASNKAKRLIDLGVVIGDQTISGYSAFQRKLYDTQPYSLSSFTRMGTKSPDKITSKKIISRSKITSFKRRRGRSKPIRARSRRVKRVTTKTLVPSGNCLYVTRVLTTGFLGTKYGNFSQSSIRGGPILPNRLVFNTTPTDKGVAITLLSGVPEDISGMCFVRRDISHGVTRGRWKKILGANSAITTSAYVASFPESGTIGFSVLDPSVREGRTYEYKAKIYMKNGVSKLSTNSRFEKYVKPTGAMVVTLSDFSYSKSTAASDTSVSVSFNINYSLEDSDSDILLKLISDAGLTSLYSEELSELKDNLSNLVSFRVERLDIRSGETIDLGITTSGAFTDSGSKSMSPPALTSEYIYRVYPFLVSPDDIINQVTESTSVTSSPTRLGSTRSVRNPSKISIMRKRAKTQSSPSLGILSNRQDALIKSKGIRDFSGRGLMRGILSSRQSSSTSNILEAYKTGDIIENEFSTGEVSIEIKPGKITFGGQGGPIVRWSIEGGDSSHSKYIDYFVVVAKKQGSYQAVGNCHASYTSGTYTFIDYVSVGYVGLIEYFIVPVLLNGSISKRQSAGSTFMPDINTKFRRGN